MKKIQTLILAIVLLFAVTPISVVAQQQSSSRDIKKSVEERKKRLKTRLDTTAQKRVVDRCEKAQIKIEKILTRINDRAAKRDKKYADFEARIDELIAKIQARGGTTAELNEALSSVKNQREVVAKSFAQQKTALEDLSKMDCKGDPVGFMAALIDARAYSAEVQKARSAQSKAVKQELRSALSNVVGANNESR
jgi:chromosome segregation ATPase